MSIAQLRFARARFQQQDADVRILGQAAASTQPADPAPTMM